MNVTELHRCIIANNPVQVSDNLKALGISIPEGASDDYILDAVYAKADALGCVDGVNKVIVPAFSVSFNEYGACADDLADYLTNSLPIILKAEGHNCMGNTEVISAGEYKCYMVCRWLALGFIILVAILVLKSLFK